jgi:histone-lysine N-methyltransferase SETMAR
MSRHFDISPPTVKQILSRELGLKKCTRTWAHHLSEDQKKFRVDESRMLLDMLQLYAEHNFEGIATGDGSWFRYSIYADSMFAPSVEAILPKLYSENTRIARRKGASSFSVHMENSMCHNIAKITEKLAKKHIAPALHPPYSRDLSPCDFWLFGISKEKMKDRVFRNEQHILAAITWRWNELTFKDIQKGFQNWMERLVWTIANSGEYYLS